MNILKFELPPREEREKKRSPILNFVNVVAQRLHEDHCYALYHLFKVFYLILILDVLILNALVFLHAKLGYFPDLVDRLDVYSLFHVYEYFLDYTGIILILLIPPFAFWLNRKYSFGAYDYAHTEKQKSQGKVFTKKTYLETSLILLSLSPFLVVLFLYPSLMSGYFEQERHEGVYIILFDSHIFVFIASLFIAFFQNLFFQALLLGTIGFLSSMQFYLLWEDENK